MACEFQPGWLDSVEPTQVYKQDRRSRVWRIDTPGGRAYVVKRFEYSPIKQMLACMLRIHPGQRERRCCEMLKAAGLAVVPIVGGGVSKRKYWLVTPYTGKSLYNLLHHGELTDPQKRMQLMTAVGQLTGRLAYKGLFNRDHKASNVVVDDDGKPWLIDVVGVRRSRGQKDTDRMLANLRSNLLEAGASKAECDLLEQTCRAGG